MSADLNLPTVSARLDGDVSGLVSQFKRAETQTSITTSKIDAEVGEMQRRISRRFSLGHLGTEVLRGFGIGGGFAIAENAANKIAEPMKELSEATKDAQAASERSFQINKDNAEKRLSDGQRLTLLTREMASKQRQLKALENPYNPSGSERMFGPSSRSAEWVRKLFTYGRNEKSPDQLQESGRLTEDIARTGKARDDLVRKMDADFKGASTDLGTKLQESYREMKAKDKKESDTEILREQLKEMKELNRRFQHAMGDRGSALGSLH